MFEQNAHIKINFAVLKWMLVPLLLPLLLPNQPLTAKKHSGQVERFEHNKNLQADADALLSLFDEMPPVAIYVGDEPILKSGTNTERGVAYTTCEYNESPTIYIKKTFYENANRKQLVNILKHELTHAWLCRQNLMSGHDESFRRKFEAVGGFGN